MNKNKTTQLSGLTDYEIDLLECVDNIRFEKHSLKAIKILEKFVDKILSEEIKYDGKICRDCGKYKRLQGNGIMHQLCECGN